MTKYTDLLDSLTDKQAQFVKLYTGNNTESARLAGYSPKTAKLTGHRLITNDTVKAAIQLRDNGSGPNKKAIATREDLQALWSEIARDSDIPWKDRIMASEKLAKSLGMFIDHIRVEDITQLSDRQLEARLVEGLVTLGIKCDPVKLLQSGGSDQT